jgi:O-antigen ligase
VLVAPLAALLPVAFADGGYFRHTWTPTIVAYAALGAMALLLDERLALRRGEVLAACGLFCFGAWAALSAAWSRAPTDSLEDAQRTLLYVCAFVALLLVSSRASAVMLLAGVVGAVTVVGGYALGDRLLSGGTVAFDPVEGTLLIEPVGYANALGILVALGALLAVGLVAHSPHPWAGALAGGAVILLLATLTLTESRGAWLALAVGLVVVLAGGGRERVVAAVVVLVLPASLAVILTARATALRDSAATAAETRHEGHRLALALVAPALVSAFGTLAVPWLGERLGRLRLGGWFVAGVLVAAVVALAVTLRGGSFGPRTEYWRVAWHEFAANRWIGSGSGTFWRFWADSGAASGVQDAHSLYLETLAELGLVGLAFLVVALATPLVVALRVRDDPVVALAAGAYVLFLVHAGLDWDWEMPAVTLAGIACAVALLVSARQSEPGAALETRARCAVFVALGLFVALAVIAQLAVG